MSTIILYGPTRVDEIKNCTDVEESLTGVTFTLGEMTCTLRKGTFPIMIVEPKK